MKKKYIFFTILLILQYNFFYCKKLFCFCGIQEVLSYYNKESNSLDFLSKNRFLGTDELKELIDHLQSGDFNEIKEIHISFIALDDEDIAKFIEDLGSLKLKKLKKLDISNFNFDSLSSKAFINFLLDSKLLEFLELRQCTFNEKFIPMVLTLMPQDNALKELILINNNLTDQYIEQIIVTSSYQKLNQIEVLNFKDNHITLQGLRKILLLIQEKNFPNLKYLSLENNNIEWPSIPENIMEGWLYEFVLYPFLNQ